MNGSERQDSQNFSCFPTQEWCTWELPKIVFKILMTDFKALISKSMQGTKIFQYCTWPAGRVTYNFHSSCKHMQCPLKGYAIKNIRTSLSNSCQSTRPTGRMFGKKYSSFPDFTRNYEWNFCPLLYETHLKSSRFSTILFT